MHLYIGAVENLTDLSGKFSTQRTKGIQFRKKVISHLISEQLRPFSERHAGCPMHSSLKKVILHLIAEQYPSPLKKNLTAWHTLTRTTAHQISERRENMEIKRDLYLNKLIRKQKNGLIKVVTGIKGCGKSYLLFHLFHDHLLKSGMPPDHIIEIALDDDRNAELQDPDAILRFLLNAIQDQQDYCILLDEVQRLNEFEDILNTLLHIRNADVYVTGSHARGLSSDIITEFRGRGDEIRIHPLKFSEYLPACGEEPKAAWDNYLKYGGLPQLLAIEDPGAREDCLKSLLQEEYLPGIALRCGLQRRDKLGALLEVLAAAPDRCTSSLELSRSLAGMKKPSSATQTALPRPSSSAGLPAAASGTNGAAARCPGTALRT